MRSLSRNRRLNLLGAVIAFGLIGYALYAQHFQNYAPCLLCVFQRIAMIALGMTFATAAVHDPARVGARIYGILGMTIAASGASIAARHLYLQYTPSAGYASCGPSGLDGVLYLMDILGPRSALHNIFYPTGSCAMVDWTFLGLSMPGWVLIWFVALGVLAFIGNRRRQDATQFTHHELQLGP
jgi:protein dithiol:quinone oxidoreductase